MKNHSSCFPKTLTALSPACFLFALLGAAGCTKNTAYDPAPPTPLTVSGAAVLADTAFTRTLATGGRRVVS